MGQGRRARPIAFAAVLATLIPTGDGVAQSDCDQWPGRAFMAQIDAPGVAACLAAGADLSAEDQNGLGALQNAIAGGADRAAIAALIEAGTDVNADILTGAPPLHIALYFGRDPSIASLLLDHGANPNGTDMLGYAALHTALQAGADLPVLQMLVEAGAEINFIAVSDSMHTPLITAIGQGASYRVIEWLIEAGADPAVRDGLRHTVLSIASGLHADPRVVQLIVDQGVEVNALQGQAGGTALHSAARNRTAPADMIALLLDADACPTVEDDSGRLALEIAEGNEAMAGSEALERLRRETEAALADGSSACD